MSDRIRVNYWAEGPTDRAAARKIIEFAGGEPGLDYSKRRGATPGKDYLDKKLVAFNSAAQHAPWLVLRDGDGECSVALARRLLAQPALQMRLRVVVPAIESWLMADREGFSRLMGIAPSGIPAEPEELSDIKERVLELARNSRDRQVRNDFLPAQRSGRREGPGYASRLIGFIEGNWSPARGLSVAPSLRRAIESLRALSNCR